MKLASKRSNRPARTKLRLQLGMALAMSATALGADAAGLGRLNVLSSIGQPLRAEIELTSVSRDEAGALSARLAPPDAFSQANIDYGSALSGLRFSIQRRANGQPFVLVTSNQLVNEPFLDVLVELTWASGRLVREYTVLLDPPGLQAQREFDPSTSIVPAQAPTVVTRAPAPRRAPPAASSSTASSSSPSASPAPSAAPARSLPPSPGSSSGDYVVRSGDTALSISRGNKPEGVSLEQMLAALYRDNPQAFNGNINKLLAGATVKLPDAAAAQSLDGSEARRVVASDFSGYRDRLARNAAVVPSRPTAGQQASGKLSTQVVDGATPGVDAKDRLQLSRPDATKAAPAAAGGTRGGLGAGAPPVDELAAKDHELQETRSRIALLEKNMADLQRLVEMKNQTLADLQKGTGAATKAPDAATSAPAPTPVAPPPVVAPPAPVAATPVPPAVVTAPAPTPPAVAATPAPAPAPAPVAVAPPNAAPTLMPGSDEKWYDGLKDNSLLLFGLIAIVVLLLVYGFFTMRRRRKLASFEDSIFVDNSVLHANSVFGTTGGQSVDTANSGFHSNFVPVAGNLPEQSEVDPVAEADVYIAYGRDAQAEEILKEALRGDAPRPAVRLKLLEIYAKRGDAKTFETMASELYASTGGQGDDWKQAAALGLTIDPHNPLYAESPAPAAVPPAAVPTRIRTSIEPGATTGLGAGLGGTLGGPALNMGDSLLAAAPPPGANDLLRTEPLPRVESAPAPSMDLDFDLGFTNLGMKPLQPGASTTAPPPVAPAPSDKPRASGLDFDVGAGKPLIDPFTASAFGAGDSSARTAVNLPAFRARAEQDAPAPKPDSDGFSASEIFGSSIVGDPDQMFAETPPVAAPSPASTPSATQIQARTTDFRHAVDSHEFDKTEPLDAFSNINLDLDNGGYESTELAPDFGAKTDIWQAMATKLDLALAYSDIGDKDGARELLEEVVRNGDQTQADRARTLIGELG